MIAWNPFAIAALFTALSSLWVAVNFLIYGKNKLHYLWAVFNLSIFGWSFLVSLAAMTKNPTLAYDFWNYSHGIGIFVSILFFHSVACFCKLEAKNLIRLSYIYGLLHLYIIFILKGQPINQGINYLFNSMYYLEVKKWNFLFELGIWLFLAIYGNFKLYIFYKKSLDKNEEKHAVFLLIGAVIGYLGGASTFLPMLGFHSFYPISIVGVGIYCLINTYAIFKHQFLQIKVIYKTSITYSFLIALITITYLLGVIVLEKIVKTLFGYTSTNVSILIAFIVGVFFIPLRNFLQSAVDNAYFRRSPLEMAQENTLLRQEVIQTEKLRSIATLASGLAHEIRNPLTTLCTFAEYFPQKKDDVVFLEKCQTTLANETARINELINQLLAFAKPSQSESKQTYPQSVLEETLLLVSPRCIKNQIQVIKHFEAPNAIYADSNQLKQAFLNIILNAIEAMPNGGSISIATSVDKSLYFISIKDTGPGINPKDIKQIFDPFFSKKEKGTGLGLAITHGIIEQHGGRIYVKSKTSETSFTIQLPIRTVPWSN
jgi:signal transduction histidine kinase